MCSSPLMQPTHKPFWYTYATPWSYMQTTTRDVKSTDTTLCVIMTWL